LEKLSSEDFLNLILEDINSCANSKKFASNILQAFNPNILVFEKAIKHKTKIDVSFPIYKENNNFSLVLKNYITQPNNNKGWNNILYFIECLNNNSKYSFVNEIWLEFDERESKSGNSKLPGIYFNINNFSPTQINDILTLTFLLKKSDKLFNITSKLIRILNFVETNCQYMGIGVFLGRRNQPIRIGWLMDVQKVIPLSKHFPIEDKIVDFLKFQHKNIGDKVIVHFDISDEKINFQGIEVYKNNNKNWGDIYDSLSHSFFCDSSLKSRILKYNDTYFKNLEFAIIKKENLKLKSYYEYFYFGINHFKILNNKKIDTKIYYNLSFIDKIN